MLWMKRLQNHFPPSFCCLNIAESKHYRSCWVSSDPDLLWGKKELSEIRIQLWKHFSSSCLTPGTRKSRSIYDFTNVCVWLRANTDKVCTSFVIKRNPESLNYWNCSEENAPKQLTNRLEKGKRDIVQLLDWIMDLFSQGSYSVGLTIQRICLLFPNEDCCPFLRLTDEQRNAAPLNFPQLN